MSGNDREPDGARSWLIAIVGSAAMVFTIGTPYSYSVFLEPLSRAYGVPTVTLSAVFSTELGAFYVTAGILGVLIARVTVRSVLLAAVALTALLAPALYVVGSVLSLAVVFGLLGTALGVVYVTLVSVVPQWFRDRRGLATGVLFAGNGISLLVLPPAWRFVFELMGVRRGFLAIVLLTSFAFLLASAVCRRPPWTQQTSMSVRQIAAWVVRVSRSKSSQLLFLGVGLAFMWYYLLAGYAIKLFTDRGLSEATATLLFGAIGGISVVSRVGSGVVADRVGYGRTFAGALWCAAAGCLLLVLSSVPAIAAAILLFGIALGGVGTLYAPLLLRAYPTDKSTAVIGLSNVVFGVFALGAPPIGTALTSGDGSYTGVILVTFLSVLGALGATWLGTSLHGS